MAVGMGLAVAAWVPLVLYGIVETMRCTTGGNPVGLGLLAVLGTGIGVLTLIAGGILASRADDH